MAGAKSNHRSRSSSPPDGVTSHAHLPYQPHFSPLVHCLAVSTRRTRMRPLPFPPRPLHFRSPLSPFSENDEAWGDRQLPRSAQFVQSHKLYVASSTRSPFATPLPPPPPPPTPSLSLSILSSSLRRLRGKSYTVLLFRETESI